MPYGDLTGRRAGRGWGTSQARSGRSAYFRHPKSFRAKFAGTCAECHHEITVGQHIRKRADDPKKYQHVSCYFG